MTKNITIYKTYNGTWVVKIHRALSRILLKDEENNLKDAIRKIMVVTVREVKYATKYKRMGS